MRKSAEAPGEQVLDESGEQLLISPMMETWISLAMMPMFFVAAKNSQGEWSGSKGQGRRGEAQSACGSDSELGSLNRARFRFGSMWLVQC